MPPLPFHLRPTAISVVGFVVCSMFWAKKSHALFTSSVSYTEGAWEGISGAHQWATFLDWKINQVTQGGVETAIDMNLNNDIVQNA